MKKWSIFLCVLLKTEYLVFSAAGLQLPAILSSHMVLQQNETVRIWGWADQGVTVGVKAGWDNHFSYSVASENNTWEVKIKTPSAGGPHNLVISADTLIVLTDIMIGEVWICSGQSNMEMPLKGYASQPVLGSNDYILESGKHEIRLFQVGEAASARPESDCAGTWDVSQPSSVADFSAVAYLFGRYLFNALEVPIGLIDVSWDGTPVHSWTEKEVIQKKFKNIDLTVLDKGQISKRSPTALFNGMIHPLVKYAIKGVIWYQGEADRYRPEIYERLFSEMIASWRMHWGSGNIPFYFVQIAPYKYDSSCNAAYLREAQLQTMLKVPKTGMVVTTDIGEYDCIHPAEKETVGKRLAYWALADTYHIQGIKYCGPVFKRMEIKQKKVIIYFDHSENGFTSFGSKLEGFSIASYDKRFYPAEAVINRKENSIEVSSKKVELPVAVRYCWGNFIRGNLYNTAGLPASPFRSDDWKE